MAERDDGGSADRACGVHIDIGAIHFAGWQGAVDYTKPAGEAR